MTRKILGWLIFVLLASFIGFVIWLFFIRDDSQPTEFQQQTLPEDFFPVDTQNNPGQDGQNQNADGSAGNRGRSLIPRIRQLSTVPTAGGIAFERQTGSSETFITEEGVEESLSSSITIFRYIERATGHLYETRENTLTQTRLSNTTIPKIHRAFFAPDGEHVVLRLLDEQDSEVLKTISAEVTAKSTTSPATFQLVADGYALEGPFLSPNTQSIDITTNGLAYVVPNSQGGSSIITSNYDDLSKNLVFSSPLTEWMIQQINSNTLAITTKADSRVDGFLYEINSNGTTEKILGDIPGLTTLISPDGTWVLYNISRGNTIETYALNTETENTTKLDINTLPEKCAFANTDSNTLFCGATTQPERVPYPESWYQGTVSFNDNLWKIDLATGEYDQLIGDGEEVAESFDMMQLVVSPKDEFVLFINKKDLTLWVVDTTIIER